MAGLAPRRDIRTCRQVPAVLWERRQARWSGGRTATEWPAAPIAVFAAPTEVVSSSCWSRTNRTAWFFRIGF